MVPVWRGQLSVLWCWEKGTLSLHCVTLTVSDALMLACLEPGHCALLSTELSLFPLILLDVTLQLICSSWTSSLCLLGRSVSLWPSTPSCIPFLSAFLSPSGEPGHHCLEVSPAHRPELLSINVTALSPIATLDRHVSNGDLHAGWRCLWPLCSLMCSNLCRNWFVFHFPPVKEVWSFRMYNVWSTSSHLFFLSCPRSGVI